MCSTEPASLLSPPLSPSLGITMETIHQDHAAQPALSGEAASPTSLPPAGACTSPPYTPCPPLPLPVGYPFSLQSISEISQVHDTTRASSVWQVKLAGAMCDHDDRQSSCSHQFVDLLTMCAKQTLDRSEQSELQQSSLNPVAQPSQPSLPLVPIYYPPVPLFFSSD